MAQCVGMDFDDFVLVHFPFPHFGFNPFSINHKFLRRSH